MWAGTKISEKFPEGIDWILLDFCGRENLGREIENPDFSMGETQSPRTLCKYPAVTVTDTRNLKIQFWKLTRGIPFGCRVFVSLDGCVFLSLFMRDKEEPKKYEQS